jgi:hypothetical protein
MLAVMVNVFNPTWVGIYTRFCVLLQGIVGPAPFPQSVMCKLSASLNLGLFLTCIALSGTRRQFRTVCHDLPEAIPPMHVSLKYETPKILTHGFSSRFLPRCYNVPPEPTTGQVI